PPPSPDTPKTAGAPRRKAPRAGGTAASRTGGTASARTIKAKFPGRCLCGRSYAAGEKIAKNAQGWGHPECRTAEV
ncbi:ribonuclease HI, partial [Streptomyces sp. SID161]|nr:ribonuclease HI [Streptomyces sp. SID161]